MSTIDQIIADTFKKTKSAFLFWIHTVETEAININMIYRCDNESECGRRGLAGLVRREQQQQQQPGSGVEVAALLADRQAGWTRVSGCELHRWVVIVAWCALATL